MNSIQATPESPQRSTTGTEPVLLVVLTDLAGAIVSGSGRWPGRGAFPASSIADLVHERNHDLIERMVSWIGVSGHVDHGVGVQVRTIDGWDDAAITATAVAEGIQWCLTPVLPDPLRGSVQAITSGRHLNASLEVTLAAFAGVGNRAWASVHFGPDDEGRNRAVVTVDDRDTFRRAVEAAVSGDQPCPWDTEMQEDSTIVVLDAFGDGIKLAGPRAGLKACHLMAVPSATGRDAACLAVWAENPEQLESPELHLLTRRTILALTLAFQTEAGRDGLRTLATHDGLTGAWNREALFAQLRAVTPRSNCAVVYADIDKFRDVNDWHGYEVGDGLVAAVAERLRRAMRPGDLVARVSGDEFAILCFDVTDDHVTRAITERVHEICREPFTIAGENRDLTMTVGAAGAAEGRSGVQLYEMAERMMLELKAAAPGTWRVA